MEDVRNQLIGIRQQLQHLEKIVVHLTPKRGQLKWFGQGRYGAQLQLLFKGSEDVLNHAATLLGYFDGFTARGDFQRHVAEHFPAPKHGKLIDLLQYMQRVVRAFDAVLQDLCQRQPLMMASSGPKKPGPSRTIIVCTTHLHSLQNKLCAVVLGLASSQQLKDQALHYLNEE